MPEQLSWAFVIGGAVLALSGCGGDERTAYADTGRAPSRVPTESSGTADDDLPDASESIDPPPVSAGAALGVVEMSDARGDVDGWPGVLRYPLDILSFRIESVGDELRARFQFARPLAEHFMFPGVDGERTGGAPAYLYLDLDDDESTGAAPFTASESAWADELVGYELEIIVFLGYDFVSKSDGSEGSSGGDVIVDTDEVEITGHNASYYFGDQTPDMRLGPKAEGGFGSTPDTLPLTTIDGDVVELRIPLAWLDLESGDVVRLAYRETDEGGISGLSYSRNARLRVR